MRRAFFLQGIVAAGIAGPLPAAAVTPESRSQKIAMMAVIAGMVELPPAWICEIIFAAELAAEALCDPAACMPVAAYRVVPSPVATAGIVHADVASLSAMFAGAITGRIVALYQAAVGAQARVAADELAVWECVNRRYAAAKSRDSASSMLQQRALAGLVARAAADKQRANRAWTAFASLARASRVTDRPPVTSEPLRKLRNAPFSPQKLEAMRRFGMSDAQISIVRSMIEETGSVAVPSGLLAAIPMIRALNGRNGDMRSCSCRAVG